MIELTSLSSTESLKVGRFADRPLVLLGPQRLEAFALGDPPAGVARGIGVLAADIDLDAGDLERSASCRSAGSRGRPLPFARPRSRRPSDGDRGDSKDRTAGAAAKAWRAFGDNGVEIQAALWLGAAGDDAKATHLCRCRRVDRRRQCAGQGDRPARQARPRGPAPMPSLAASAASSTSRRRAIDDPAAGRRQ